MPEKKDHLSKSNLIEKSTIKNVLEKTNQKLDLNQELIFLKKENSLLQDKVNRALADYQNLVRRQKEEQSKIVEFAKIAIFESLLQPLEHLTLATQALNDEGLNMVVKQLWQTLEKQGLKEFQPLNQKFDPLTMEVVEKVGQGEIVSEIVSPGYILNNQVIKFTKVKVGK